MTYPPRSTSNPAVGIHYPGRSTFDLQLMMHAIPPSVEIGQSNIYCLPNEVLGEIFDHLLFSSHIEGDLLAPIFVSHVSNHWRKVILDMATQWEVLRVRHTRRADVLSDILSRSRHRDLILFIDFLKPMSTGVDGMRDLSETFEAIVAHIPRLHTLSITADNTTFHNLTRFLINIPLDKLQRLELIQHGDKPCAFFGPFIFNPNVFTTLRLERVMVDCDASCLTGIRRLDLQEASGTILNQLQLLFATYPDIPTTPMMARLNHLRIHSTNLILSTGALVPSFSLDSLLHLELSNIHMTNQLSLHPIVSLFNITLNPLLEELVLEEIDIASLHHFTQLIRVNPPKFPVLQSLTMSRINLRALATYIAPATPAISSLNLTKVNMDVDMVRDFLNDVDLWPLITRFSLDGKEYLRSY